MYCSTTSNKALTYYVQPTCVLARVRTHAQTRYTPHARKHQHRARRRTNLGLHEQPLKGCNQTALPASTTLSLGAVVAVNAPEPWQQANGQLQHCQQHCRVTMGRTGCALVLVLVMVLALAATLPHHRRKRNKERNRKPQKVEGKEKAKPQATAKQSRN